MREAHHGGSALPPAFFVNILFFGKFIMSLKPYDNQLRVPSDELAEMYHNNEHNTTPVKVLITNCEDERECWIARNRTDHDIVIIPAYSDDASWYARWRVMRKSIKQIKHARSKNHRIIWSGESLTKKDRSRILKHLPNYRKYAIVWEQNLADMLNDGYERPSLDEGFDDFTYVVS